MKMKLFFKFIHFLKSSYIQKNILKNNIIHFTETAIIFHKNVLWFNGPFSRTLTTWHVKEGKTETEILRVIFFFK